MLLGSLRKSYRNKIILSKNSEGACNCSFTICYPSLEPISFMLVAIWKDFLGKRENISFKPPLFPAFKLPNTHRNMLLNVTKSYYTVWSHYICAGEGKGIKQDKKWSLYKLFFIVQTKRKGTQWKKPKQTNLFLNTKPVVIQGLYFKLLLILWSFGSNSRSVRLRQWWSLHKPVQLKFNVSMRANNCKADWI